MDSNRAEADEKVWDFFNHFLNVTSQKSCTAFWVLYRSAFPMGQVSRVAEISHFKGKNVFLQPNRETLTYQSVFRTCRVTVNVNKLFFF